jgi:hypothetical protein
MRLSELIEETLSEIALGVKSAKEKSRNQMVIAPGTVDDKVVAEITYIEFDVSIAVSDKTDTGSTTNKGAGAEIKVLSIGGISGRFDNKIDESNSSSSQFSHRISLNEIL